MLYHQGYHKIKIGKNNFKGYIIVLFVLIAVKNE